jgi:hypothetical protein
MKTRHLQMNIGAYSAGGWYVSIVEDIYERGVQKDSRIVWGPLHCSLAQLKEYADSAVRELIWQEEERLKEEGGADQAERSRPLQMTQ